MPETNNNFTHLLQDLMQQVGISSFKALSRACGVSERQILRLRQGNIKQMRVDVLLKLSQTLQITLSELITTFSVLSEQKEQKINSSRAKRPATANSAAMPAGLYSTQNSALSNTEQNLLQEIADLKREYERSQLALEQQRELLQQEFQQTSLQLLESLLLQWPTAAQRAKENQQLAAIKIVPLVQKPLEKLLQAWGVEAIAPVGAEVPYNPQFHQLIEGSSQPGEIVKVRYIGYRQGEKLLYRAKVSPI
ncbi:MAG: nucleotide exchange factor GrpE [Aulosira sp. DedQUE10]|nr:nucleotide exchange factor GrpE [Aulosira sp. DedQUE10]